MSNGIPTRVMGTIKHHVYCFLVGWRSPLADLSREIQARSKR